MHTSMLIYAYILVYYVQKLDNAIKISKISFIWKQALLQKRKAELRSSKLLQTRTKNVPSDHERHSTFVFSRRSLAYRKPVWAIKKSVCELGLTLF